MWGGVLFEKMAVKFLCRKKPRRDGQRSTLFASIFFKKRKAGRTP
jgi:hypothetical protein